jgi:hypothetical protein
VTECRSGVTEFEDMVDDGLESGGGDGAYEILRIGAVPDSDGPGCGASAFEAEVVDSRVRVTEEADQRHLAADRDCPQ